MVMTRIVRILVRVKVNVSINRVIRVRMGSENSACRVYLSVPDGKQHPARLRVAQNWAVYAILLHYIDPQSMFM